MSLISDSIPNFVNGVSQQPFTLRLSSQGELQENGLSTVSAGLRKRPPTEHVAKLAPSPLSSAFIHTINRDAAERYQVVVTPGDLQVFDLAGNPIPVAFTDKAYLNTAKPAEQSFAMTTVADYTFVVNKTVPVLVSTASIPSRPNEALFNVKVGNYGKAYSILVNGAIVATYTTPDGAAASDAPYLSTEFIAASLYTAMATAGFNTAPWNLQRHGSVLYLKNSSTDFTVAAEDGFSNNAMVAIKGRLQKFTDLPANPRLDGFTVEIIGDQASDFDNYWVKFDAGGSNDATGVWRETVAPGIKSGLKPESMPHQLIRQADGTFTFGPCSWATRKVGDSTSNPQPSFVGRTINDIFFYQNRLGFLSDENYFQSETGKYFNVYRTTVTTLLDSDPVDVNAATNKVAILEHAVSFNKQLLLFSNQQQFVVDSESIMTPKKVPIKPTTEFAVNTKAKPAAAGRNVYFCADRGKWANVREFFVEQTSGTNDAGDITSHVPKYIPGGIVKIAAGAAEDVLVLLSERNRGRLYVYKYFFSGSEKLQSSWSDFSFDVEGSILDVSFIESVLYLVISRPDGLYLERMDFSLGAEIDGEPYTVHLDRKVVVGPASMSYADGFTTIAPEAIGYTPAGTGFLAVTHGGGSVKAGQVLAVSTGAGLRIKGDITASPVSFGCRYTFRYRLSPVTIKTPAKGGGIKSDTDGRLQVRKIAFNHSETGFYKVLVTPEARATYTYVFSGKVLGSSSARIGGTALATGNFSVPVMSRNTTVDITVESDGPNPVAILSADWEGFYVRRSQPV